MKLASLFLADMVLLALCQVALGQADAHPAPRKLKFTGELRSRLESRTGPSFGAERDLFANFVRSRIGVSYSPVQWVRFSALVQDARAPLYGSRAPGSVRDPIDLQEAFAEFSGNRKTGAGGVIGRQMVNYGDTRILGSPQWAYTARTYDTARIIFRTATSRLEFLFLSPIKPRGDGFNRPVLGDRVWGMYHVFSGLPAKTSADVYALRHDQNRPGGFTGPGYLRTNTFGVRLAAPLAGGFRYTWEGMVQNGSVSSGLHRAGAYAGQLGYAHAIHGKRLDLFGEYKFASRDFDVLYPAAHDKLGHADLIGWKNTHNVKSAATLALTSMLSVTAMHNATWLADPAAPLYGLQGRALTNPRASAGARYAGQELDLILSLKTKSLQGAAGYGHFFMGRLMRMGSPGVSPRFWYITQSVIF